MIVHELKLCDFDILTNIMHPSSLQKRVGMLSPKLSVVLTVYNMEDCLTSCLDDIVEQEFTDFELICIDDGSTDNSLEILKSYADKDSRLRLITQKNKGAAQSRNLGLDEACGTYVMLLDSDDLFEPNFFGSMMDKAETTHSDIVTCRTCEYDHQSKKTIPAEWIVKKQYLPTFEPFSALDTKGCIFTALMGWPWDKLYRTSFLRKNNLRFPSVKNSEDLYFVYLALVKAERLSIVDEVLIKHRINRVGSVSNSRMDAPTCFYQGITLLKQELRKDPETYHQLEWGFLNWALDYTCWNIDTLPQGKERDLLIRHLFSGEFAELELESHVLEYYLLYPNIIRRYQKLEEEFQGKPRKKHLWSLFGIVCHNIDRYGFSSAMKTAWAYIRHGH